MTLIWATKRGVCMLCKVCGCWATGRGGGRGREEGGKGEGEGGRGKVKGGGGADGSG